MYICKFGGTIEYQKFVASTIAKFGDSMIVKFIANTLDKFGGTIYYQKFVASTIAKFGDTIIVKLHSEYTR